MDHDGHAIALRFEERLIEHRHVRAVAAVPLGRRSLKVFVALIALIAALQNFGFNVTGIIAGTRFGDELALLYTPVQIAASPLRDRLTWRWNGQAFAP